MLRVTDLCAGYGGAQVLFGVNLKVDEGQLVVVTGPNGHGKTTLLRVISGLIPAWSGHVDFQGERIDGGSTASVVAGGLAHIPQGDLLFQDLTVEQNLLMGAYQKQAWRQRQALLVEVFDLFPALRERRAQQSRTLSGGERRMVAIGRGLMSNARVIMVDEPALGLAPVLVRQLYSTLAEIARNGKTLLLCEESLNNAKEIADYVYLMEQGRMAHEGGVTELYASGALQSAYLGSGETA